MHGLSNPIIYWSYGPNRLKLSGNACNSSIFLFTPFHPVQAPATPASCNARCATSAKKAGVRVFRVGLVDLAMGRQWVIAAPREQDTTEVETKLEAGRIALPTMDIPVIKQYVPRKGGSGVEDANADADADLNKTKSSNEPEVEKKEEEEEEEDPWISRIRKGGCFNEHEKMQDCYYEHKDWRKCTLEMKQFKECFAVQQMLKSKTGTQ